MRIAYVALDTTRASDVTLEPTAIAEAVDTRSAEIAALYEERRAEFDQPEQVRARHLLLRTEGEEEAALASASARAVDLLARIEGGEPFADVAREHTQDEASRATGGDLGFFSRGQMVPEFEDAAFGAEVGVPIGPIESPFGVHLILVEEHREPVLRTLEEVQEELAGDLLREDAGRAAAQETADALVQAVQGGSSLEVAARDRELTLERSGWLTRRPDGYVPGLGAAPDVLAAAFASEVGAGADRIFRAGRKLALVEQDLRGVGHDQPPSESPNSRRSSDRRITSPCATRSARSSRATAADEPPLANAAARSWARMPASRSAATLYIRR